MTFLRATLIVMVSSVVLGVLGCATIPVADMQHVTSILTTGGSADAVKFDRTPQTGPFGIGNRIYFLTTLRWDDTSSGAGNHKVKWKWYSGEKEISILERTFNFNTTPFELRGSILASALGAGHHKVEVYIDDKLFDSKNFDVAE